MSADDPGALGSTRVIADATTTHRRLGRGFVRVRSGPLQGLDVPFKGRRVTGGRSPVNDLVLEDDAVSSMHFELRLTDEAVRLRDLGSTNGTWVGGARLFDAALELGTSFVAGETEIQIVAAEEVDVEVTEAERFEGLFGRSPQMREVFAVLARLAPTPIDVLVGGETGTGKELVARALHTRSERPGAFVVLDCASLPRELAESAILGHAKGSFTGAIADQPGVFEDADGGTLFIDEVGELPLTLQPKLLRVLERREVVRVGETRPRPVSVRIVAATHRDLRRMVAEERFREDLFFRLADALVELPPLRERGDDAVALAREFCVEFGRQRGMTPRLGDGVDAALLREPWPGNVRQLKRAVRRAVFLAEADVLHPDDFVLTTGQDSPDDDVYALPIKEARMEFERRYFRRLQDATGGNHSEMARRSGYSRHGLRDLLRRVGLYDDAP